MPHIRVRGLEEEKLRKISKNLLDGLQEKIECPRDYLTLELVESKFIECEFYPFVEVLWFDRGRNVKQEVASFVTDLIKSINPNQDVCVMFLDLIKEDYFENKEHF